MKNHHLLGVFLKRFLEPRNVLIKQNKLMLCNSFTCRHDSLVLVFGVKSSGSTVLNKHMAEFIVHPQTPRSLNDKLLNWWGCFSVCTWVFPEADTQNVMIFYGIKCTLCQLQGRWATSVRKGWHSAPELLVKFQLKSKVLLLFIVWEQKLQTGWQIP